IDERAFARNGNAMKRAKTAPQVTVAVGGTTTAKAVRAARRAAVRRPGRRGGPRRRAARGTGGRRADGPGGLPAPPARTPKAGTRVPVNDGRSIQATLP